MNSSNKIFFIVGPTGVGKSAVGLALAQRVGGEIISCDSMQIYREINIASAKPSLEDCRKIPHHLINHISVTDTYDVFQYFKDSQSIIEDVCHRNRIPIIVGGTGLYMKVLLDGIFHGAKRDEQLRQELADEIEEKGSQVLYMRLQERDPQAAAKLHPNDAKRIIRALEVCLTKDKPISELQKQREGIWGKYDIQIFGLNRNREELYARIEKRVDEMFANGLIDEVKNIANLPLSETSKYLIGIKEILGCLNSEYDLETAKKNLKQNTRRYAKRQLTWFRAEERIKWIELEKETRVDEVVDRILT